MGAIMVADLCFWRKGWRLVEFLVFLSKSDLFLAGGFFEGSGAGGDEGGVGHGFAHHRGRLNGLNRPVLSGSRSAGCQQVWSQNRFYSVGFIKIKDWCVFNKRTFKVCVCWF